MVHPFFAVFRGQNRVKSLRQHCLLFIVPRIECAVQFLADEWFPTNKKLSCVKVQTFLDHRSCMNGLGPKSVTVYRR